MIKKSQATDCNRLLTGPILLDYCTLGSRQNITSKKLNYSVEENIFQPKIKHYPKFELENI